jgi:pSer/pThr/pTyr-binding forkhead associated (FHA) protein
MWILRGTGDEGVPMFRLPRGAAKTVGRAPRADFILKAGLVSRLHCRIVARDDQLEVEDLSSTNGTFVNDKRVSRHVLSEGDVIKIGETQILYKTDTARG